MGCGAAHNLTRTRYKPSQIVKLQPLYEEWELDKGNNFIAGLRLKKCRKTFFKTDKGNFYTLYILLMRLGTVYG